MKKWLNHWIKVETLLGLFALIIIIVKKDTLSMTSIYFLILSIILPLHVLEEWIKPGGFYYLYNSIVMGSDDSLADHYPMNQITDMLTNFVGEMIFIICSFIYYKPLTIMLCLFCFIEFFGHLLAMSILSYRRYHTFYNPGYITSILGYLPLGIMSLHYILIHHYSINNWIIGIICTLLLLIICIVIPESLLKSKENDYGFYKDYGYGYYSKYKKKKD